MGVNESLFLSFIWYAIHYNIMHVAYHIIGKSCEGFHLQLDCQIQLVAHILFSIYCDTKRPSYVSITHFAKPDGHLNHSQPVIVCKPTSLQLIDMEMHWLSYPVIPSLGSNGSAHCVCGLIKIFLMTNIPQPQMVFLFTDGHVAQEGMYVHNSLLSCV